MFDTREAATILAALLFWQEEMGPHGPEIMRPYFESVGKGHVAPLPADGIDRLMEKVRRLEQPGPAGPA